MIVSAFDLGVSDVLVIRVPVGLMPPARTKEYLEEVKEKLHDVFGKDQKILALPSRGEEVEIAIIKRTR